MEFTIDWSDYLPDNGVKREEAALVRREKEVAIKSLYPDLDTRPGSPFGDLYLTPSAYSDAETAVAASRFLEDLDITNAQQNRIWNCPFVEQYLASLGVGADRVVPSYGLLYIAVESTATFFYPADTVFAEGQAVYTTEGSFFTGLVKIGLPEENPHFPLYAVSPDLWVAEIPVRGTAEVGGDGDPVSIERGTVFSTDAEDTPIVEITAAIDFDPGFPPKTLQDRAKLVPHVFPGFSLNNVSGIRAWFYTFFRQAAGASPVISGDDEMVRDNKNLLMLPEGKVDLYVRNKELVTRTIVIRMTRSGATWSAELPSGAVILRVSSLRHASLESLSSFTVTASSSDEENYPISEYYYTDKQVLTISTEAVLSSSVQNFDDPSNPTADFSVDILVDPFVEVVQARLSSREERPVVGDILVRPFVPAFAQEVRIFYRRKNGKEIDKSRATAEIIQYFSHCVYPDIYESSALAEIVLYWGAAGVSAVEVDWVIHSSPADNIDDGDSVTTRTTWEREGNPYQNLTDGFGARNIAPYVPASVIKFLAQS